MSKPVHIWNYRQHADQRKEERLARLRDAGIGNPEDIYDRLADESNRVSPRSERDWSQKGKRVWVGGHNPEVHANAWLRELYTELAPFFEGQTVTTVEQIAKYLSEQWAGVVRTCDIEGDPEEWAILIEKAEAFLDHLNLPFPRGATDITAMRRLQDAKWWRRQLNTAIPRIIDQNARKFGQVHKDQDCYLSDAAFELWRKRQYSNRKTLESLVATNDLGQEYTLAELADLSLANPSNRRTELMVRCRGIEEWAEEIGYDTALFVTLTAPSKYHSHDQSGVKYANWNYSNPRGVNDYLAAVWSRIRADLARQEVDYFGVRVAEPHHDGSPHWHLLIFTDAHQEQIEASFVRYGLAEDGNEKGARKYRIKFERIDASKGSAVGYIAKYISKNIDGFGVDSDLFAKSAKNSARRIRAWASTWGIRQFQFFGSAPIGPWRELRRVQREVHWPYEEARQAADLGEFKEYINQYLRHGFTAYREPWVNEETGETVSPFNDFGELREIPIKGIIAEGYGVPLFTRLMNWTVTDYSAKAQQNTLQPELGRCSLNCPPSGFASEARSDEIAEAWTCVTNCTQYLDPEGVDSDFFQPPDPPGGP